MNSHEPLFTIPKVVTQKTHILKVSRKDFVSWSFTFLLRTRIVTMEKDEEKQYLDMKGVLLVTSEEGWKHSGTYPKVLVKKQTL